MNANDFIKENEKRVTAFLEKSQLDGGKSISPNEVGAELPENTPIVRFVNKTNLLKHLGISKNQNAFPKPVPTLFLGSDQFYRDLSFYDSTAITSDSHENRLNTNDHTHQGIPRLFSCWTLKQPGWKNLFEYFKADYAIESTVGAVKKLFLDCLPASDNVNTLQLEYHGCVLYLNEDQYTQYSTIIKRLPIGLNRFIKREKNPQNHLQYYIKEMEYRFIISPGSLRNINTLVFSVEFQPDEDCYIKSTYCDDILSSLIKHRYGNIIEIIPL